MAKEPQDPGNRLDELVSSIAAAREAVQFEDEPTDTLSDSFRERQVLAEMERERTLGFEYAGTDDEGKQRFYELSTRSPLVSDPKTKEDELLNMLNEWPAATEGVWDWSDVQEETEQYGLGRTVLSKLPLLGNRIKRQDAERLTDIIERIEAREGEPRYGEEVTIEEAEWLHLMARKASSEPEFAMQLGGGVVDSLAAGLDLAAFGAARKIAYGGAKLIGAGGQAVAGADRVKKARDLMDTMKDLKVIKAAATGKQLEAAAKAGEFGKTAQAASTVARGTGRGLLTAGEYATYSRATGGWQAREAELAIPQIGLAEDEDATPYLVIMDPMYGKDDRFWRAGVEVTAGAVAERSGQHIDDFFGGIFRTSRSGSIVRNLPRGSKLRAFKAGMLRAARQFKGASETTASLNDALSVHSLFGEILEERVEDFAREGGFYLTGQDSLIYRTKDGGEKEVSFDFLMPKVLGGDLEWEQLLMEGATIVGVKGATASVGLAAQGAGVGIQKINRLRRPYREAQRVRKEIDDIFGGAKDVDASTVADLSRKLEQVAPELAEQLRTPGGINTLDMDALEDAIKSDPDLEALATEAGLVDAIDMQWEPGVLEGARAFAEKNKTDPSNVRVRELSGGVGRLVLDMATRFGIQVVPVDLGEQATQAPMMYDTANPGYVFVDPRYLATSSVSNVVTKLWHETDHELRQRFPELMHIQEKMVRNQSPEALADMWDGYVRAVLAGEMKAEGREVRPEAITQGEVDARDQQFKDEWGGNYKRNMTDEALAWARESAGPVSMLLNTESGAKYLEALWNDEGASGLNRMLDWFLEKIMRVTSAGGLTTNQRQKLTALQVELSGSHADIRGVAPDFVQIAGLLTDAIRQIPADAEPGELTMPEAEFGAGLEVEAEAEAEVEVDVEVEAEQLDEDVDEPEAEPEFGAGLELTEDGGVIDDAGEHQLMTPFEVAHGGARGSKTYAPSLAFVGTGEGVAAFGWGLYATMKALRGISSFYQKQYEATHGAYAQLNEEEQAEYVELSTQLGGSVRDLISLVSQHTEDVDLYVDMFGEEGESLLNEIVNSIPYGDDLRRDPASIEQVATAIRTVGKQLGVVMADNQAQRRPDRERISKANQMSFALMKLAREVDVISYNIADAAERLGPIPDSFSAIHTWLVDADEFGGEESFSKWEEPIGSNPITAHAFKKLATRHRATEADAQIADLHLQVKQAMFAMDGDLAMQLQDEIAVIMANSAGSPLLDWDAQPYELAYEVLRMLIERDMVKAARPSERDASGRFVPALSGSQLLDIEGEAQKAASIALRDAGLPGHKFLAQSISGDATEGEYNYVFYRDDIITPISQFIPSSRETEYYPHYTKPGPIKETLADLLGESPGESLATPLMTAIDAVVQNPSFRETFRIATRKGPKWKKEWHTGLPWRRVRRMLKEHQLKKPSKDKTLPAGQVTERELRWSALDALFDDDDIVTIEDLENARDNYGLEVVIEDPFVATADRAPTYQALKTVEDVLSPTRGFPKLLLAEGAPRFMVARLKDTSQHAPSPLSTGHWGGDYRVHFGKTDVASAMYNIVEENGSRVLLIQELQGDWAAIMHHADEAVKEAKSKGDAKEAARLQDQIDRGDMPWLKDRQWVAVMLSSIMDIAEAEGVSEIRVLTGDEVAARWTSLDYDKAVALYDNTIKRMLGALVDRARVLANQSLPEGEQIHPSDVLEGTSEGGWAPRTAVSHVSPVRKRLMATRGFIADILKAYGESYDQLLQASSGDHDYVRDVAERFLAGHPDPTLKDKSHSPLLERADHEFRLNQEGASVRSTTRPDGWDLVTRESFFEFIEALSQPADEGGVLSKEQVDLLYEMLPEVGLASPDVLAKYWDHNAQTVEVDSSDYVEIAHLPNPFFALAAVMHKGGRKSFDNVGDFAQAMARVHTLWLQFNGYQDAVVQGALFGVDVANDNHNVGWHYSQQSKRLVSGSTTPGLSNVHKGRSVLLGKDQPYDRSEPIWPGAAQRKTRLEPHSYGHHEASDLPGYQHITIPISKAIRRAIPRLQTFATPLSSPDLNIGPPPNIELGVIGSLKAYIKRNFTALGGMPLEAWEAKIKAKAEFDALLVRAGFLQKDLKKAIKREWGDATPEQRQLLNDYLAAPSEEQLMQRGPQTPESLAASKESLAEHIPTDIFLHLNRQRMMLDTLSRRIVSAGIPTAGTQAIIVENDGMYLHRSYQVFDDPNWYKKVPPEVIAAARDFLERELAGQGKTRDQIDGLVQALLMREDSAADRVLRGDAGSIFSAISRLDSKDLSILKRRKDVPPEIRALWGEYNDPMVNYLKSVEKMGSLLQAHEFLTDMRSAGIRGGWLSDAQTGPIASGRLITKVAAEDSEVLAPLNGMYGTPELVQALNDTFTAKVATPWLRWYLKLNSTVKLNKTVLSVMTQVRNFWGNVGFAVAAGHWNLTNMGPAMADTARGLLGLDSDAEFRERMIELTRLGVLGQGARSAELREYMQEAYGDGWLEFSDSWIARTVKGGMSHAQRLYAAGDEVWKLFAYASEYGRLRDAYSQSERTDEQVKREAAEVVANTYPTYNRVPKAIQMLRRFPVTGTFTSFAWEVYRTGYHSIRLAAEQIASDNAKIRTIGWQRVLGIAVAGGSAQVISKATRALFGYDDEDDKQIRRFMAPWEQHHDFMYMPRGEDGHPVVVDMSYTNPYSYLTGPINALISGEDWEASLTDATWQVFEPYLGEEILFKALREVRSNRKDSGAPIWNPVEDNFTKIEAGIEHLWKAGEPGAIRQAYNIYKAQTGVVESWGGQREPATEIAAVTLGMRMKKMNIPQAISWKAVRHMDNKQWASSILSKAVETPGSMTDEQIVAKYQKMDALHHAQFNEMVADYQAALRFGYSSEEIMAAMAPAIGKKAAYAVKQGDYSIYMWKPSRQWSSDYFQRAFAMRKTDPAGAADLQSKYMHRVKLVSGLVRDRFRELRD